MAYDIYSRTPPCGVVLSPPQQGTPPHTAPPGHGGPRAGEDEPESTLDNDEKIEKTSHRDTRRDSPGSRPGPHADTPDAPGRPTGPQGQAPC
ncbi:hypothetical protein [Komagataeibacter rhaeticus]|uniref:hypothetical protein n=1 Tax=Komagataeibacter rhaeticus TaxID=215221 RepID=UPI0039E86923